MSKLENVNVHRDIITESFSYALLPLHKHPHLAEACASILNEEWPRSIGARLHQVEKSFDDGPTSLVLIQDAEDGQISPDKVIGYSKISQVVGIDDAIIVESVIVSKPFRGRGLGRLLMEKTHAFARNRGFATVYLSTHDKQNFYARLGYEYCTPVCSLHSNGGINAAIESLFIGKCSLGVPLSQLESASAKTDTDSTINPFDVSSSFSAPPAPPPPVLSHFRGKKTESTKSSKSPNVVRMDPRNISWMRLDLLRNPLK